MSRKSNKGYFVKGEFVVAGSDKDRRIRDELKDANALSRTALKKASEEVQDVGEQLLAAREELLDPLALPEELKDAILDAREVTSFGAKRRQMKFIGKLMRRLDAETLETIRSALRAEQGQAAIVAQVLHRAEAWRDSLIADDNCLERWIEEFPGSDIQQLRALIRQARKDAQNAGPGDTHRHGRAYRQIFSHVRSRLS